MASRILCIWTSLLVLLCGSTVGRAELVGAAVIPHGDFAYDPSVVHFANGSVELHNGSIKAGKHIIHKIEARRHLHDHPSWTGAGERLCDL